MKKTTLLILFCLGFLLLPLSSVYTAFSYDTLTLSASYPDENPQNQILHHSSGKFFYCYYDAPSDRHKLQIYTSDGVHESEQLIAFSPAPAYDTYTSLKIVELDDDEILIATVLSYSATTSQRLYVTRMNIDTYVHNSYYADTTDRIGEQRPSPLAYAEYDSNFYFIFTTVHNAYNNEWNLQVMKYVPASNTVSEITEQSLGTLQTTVQGGPIGLVQDANATKDVFLVTSLQDDTDLPVYWRVDLSDGSNEQLATNPNHNRFTNDRRMFYIDGGIKVSGTYPNEENVLYFSFVAPRTPASTRTLTLTQHRLKFNNTITTANLLDMNERALNIYPDLPAGATANWVLGYQEEYNYITLLYPEEPDGYYIKEHIFEVNSWWNFAELGMIEESTDDMTDYIPIRTETDFVGRDLTSDFQTNEGATDVHIYYGLLVIESVWDLSLSWIPADDPLTAELTYRYTFTTTVNGRAVPVFLIGYLDGSQVFSGETDSNGEKQATAFINSGLHVWRGEIYSGGLEVYAEEFNLTYEDADAETVDPSNIVDATTNMMVTFIPIFGVVLFPALTLGATAGPIGFLAGMILGVFVGVMLGMIPVYVMFLFSLIIAMIFVSYLRGGQT